MTRLRLKTRNRLATADLYKGVAWVHNPKLFYLGMQDQWFTFNMFDAQAWWVRDVIMGRISIPTDKAVLVKDVADRIAAEDAGKDAHDAIHYQGEYVKELIAETKKGVRRRFLTIGNSGSGIGIVPCQVADERSDGELGVGQAKRKARGLRGIDLRPARQNEHPQGIVTGVAGLRQP